MDGVLVVDKPAGPTSHDMVDAVRRVLGTRRVGHTGTLDPFATGVLAVCVGRATRLARFLAAGDKEYVARVRLGFATTTDDLTGEPLGDSVPVEISGEALAAALARLVGTYDQVPPTFSARHVAGRRLYDLARRGEAVPRAAARVTVHAVELRSREGSALEVAVRCSPGTYVRALARDLGESLGVGGHLAALRRTRSGAFDLSQAVAGHDLSGAADRLLPLGALLLDVPAVTVGAEGRLRVRHGRELEREHVAGGFPEAPVPRVRVLDERGELLALAVPRGLTPGAAGLPRVPVLHPDLVLSD
ncbi:MAG TPA: tRNA pseudouridine(55) synthase TruB [Vicinamibacteria bacterium]